MQLPSRLGPDLSLPAPMAGIGIGPLNVLPGEAGVVNAQWPVAHVRRYGGFGLTNVDDTIAVQAAVTAGRTFGATVVLDGGIAGPYLVTKSINITRTGSVSAGAIPTRFVGDGGIGPYAPGGSNPSWGGILVRHNDDMVFDCTGASDMAWDGVNVTVDVGFNPKCIWGFCRSSQGGDCGRTVMMHCKAYGKCASATVYSYGAEMNDYISCDFYNTQTTAFSSAFKFTAGNIDGLASTYTTIGAGTQSNLRANIIGGNHESYGGCVYYLERLQRASFHFAHIRSGNLGQGTPVGDGTALFYVDQSAGTSDYITISGMDGENDTPEVANHGIFFTNVVRSPTFWSVQDCYFPTRIKTMFAGANVTLSQSCIKRIAENTQRGIQFDGTVISCDIDLTIPITFGTSTSNRIRIPLGAPYLNIAQENGGTLEDDGGRGFCINGTVLAAGSGVGAGGSAVLAMHVGTQPATVAQRGQLFVAATGALKYLSPGGTLTQIAPP